MGLSTQCHSGCAHVPAGRDWVSVTDEGASRGSHSPLPPGIHPPHIRECGADRTMGLLLIVSGMAWPGYPGVLCCEPCGELTWEGPEQGLTVAAAETCSLSPSYARAGLWCGRVTYLCKLTQGVFQHFHSENESPLGQDLAVSISQIFPAVIQGQKEWDRVRNHIVQLGGEPALTPGALVTVFPPI